LCPEFPVVALFSKQIFLQPTGLQFFQREIFCNQRGCIFFKEEFFAAVLRRTYFLVKKILIPGPLLPLDEKITFFIK